MDACRAEYELMSDPVSKTSIMCSGTKSVVQVVMLMVQMVPAETIHRIQRQARYYIIWKYNTSTGERSVCSRYRRRRHRGHLPRLPPSLLHRRLL